MVANVKKASVYLIAGYWIVTLLVVGLIVALGVLLRLPSAADLGVSVGQSPAYVQSMPYHPLLNLPAWVCFSWLYLRTWQGENRQREAWRLGLFWVVISIVKDLFVWVLIPSPVQMTFHEMYVEYQPWLTLTYAVILLSPVLTQRLMDRRR